MQETAWGGIWNVPIALPVPIAVKTTGAVVLPMQMWETNFQKSFRMKTTEVHWKAILRIDEEKRLCVYSKYHVLFFWERINYCSIYDVRPKGHVENFPHTDRKEVFSKISNLTLKKCGYFVPAAYNIVEEMKKLIR